MFAASGFRRKNRCEKTGGSGELPAQVSGCLVVAIEWLEQTVRLN